MQNLIASLKRHFGISGEGVKKILRDAGEAESCLSEASSFRAASRSIFSPRSVSLDFLGTFLSRKKCRTTNPVETASRIKAG
ncbi:MAG: hypothetical protein PHO36_01445 [Parabacteroides sp.]|nr:hypothetical protein [Parabacteroides sp.]